MKLNCLRYGYDSHKPRFWLRNIRQFFKNLKYARQRIAKGFCDQDLWFLNYYYAKLVSASLRDFVKKAHGVAHPDYYDRPGEYEKHINQVADCFETFVRGIDGEEDESALKRGIEMFTKDWPYLWD